MGSEIREKFTEESEKIIQKLDECFLPTCRGGIAKYGVSASYRF